MWIQWPMSRIILWALASFLDITLSSARARRRLLKDTRLLKTAMCMLSMLLLSHAVPQAILHSHMVPLEPFLVILCYVTHIAAML